MILCATYASAQSKIIDELKSSFDGDDIWVSSYNGLMDGIHPISIVIANDGKRYDSRVVISDQAKSYAYRELNGEIWLTPHEEDTKQYFRLTKSRKGLKGSLYDQNDVELMDAHLYKDAEEDDCGRMNRYYYGEIEDKKATIQLLIDNGIVHLYIDEQKYAAKFDDDDPYRILITDTEVEYTAIKISKKGKVRLYTSDESYDLVNVKMIRVKCIEKFTDDKISSDQELIIDDEAFVSFITSIKDDISRTSSGQLEYGWIWISYIDPAFVSGRIFYQGSRIRGYFMRSFIYDTKKGKEIDQHDIFKNEVSKLFDIKRYHHITLSPIGYKVSTKFDMIDGSESKVISFGEAKKYLNNKALKKL